MLNPTKFERWQKSLKVYCR